MSRRKPNKNFEQITSTIEDEILEEYTELSDQDTDFYLNKLPELFHSLKIQSCFTDDIIKCIDYYYEILQSKSVEFDVTNVKHYTTINLIKLYTINTSIESIDSIIDIIDIDKLLINLNILVKMRNNYQHVYQSWKLFVSAANPKLELEADIVGYKLTLPDLKKIKEVLNLKDFNDTLLIDMLSSGSVDGNGNIISYDFDKHKIGSCVTIKEFGVMLGNLGEI